MNNTYQVNPRAVLFHTIYDKFNKYRIYVYNVHKDQVIQVNRKGYSVLKILGDNPNISQKTILQQLPPHDWSINKLKEYLDFMVINNVIIRGGS